MNYAEEFQRCIAKAAYLRKQELREALSDIEKDLEIVDEFLKNSEDKEKYRELDYKVRKIKKKVERKFKGL